MIENLKDLELNSLDKLKDEEVLSKLSEILKEKLGLSLEEIKAPLIEYLKTHAEELTLQLPNIVPFGDYSKMLEDNESMSQFIKSEGSDSKYWMIYGISEDEKFGSLLKFDFRCQAIDEGESIKGTVFISKAGVIRHAFAQSM